MTPPKGGKKQKLLKTKKNTIMPITPAMGYLLAQGVGTLGQIGTNLGDMSYNKKEAQANREWQERMWHQQNRYNDPSQEMIRMKRAGLNPAMMYGGAGSIARADKVGSGAQARASSTAPRTDIAQYQNIKNQEVTESLLRAKIVTETQNQMLQGLQGDKILTEIEKNKLANEITEAWGMTNAYMQNLMTEAQIESIGQGTKKAIQETELRKYDKLIRKKQWEKFRDFEVEPNSSTILKVLSGVANMIQKWYDGVTNQPVTMQTVREAFGQAEIDKLTPAERKTLNNMLNNQ